jgi:hypothetical protein
MRATLILTLSKIKFDEFCSRISEWTYFDYLFCDGKIKQIKSDPMSQNHQYLLVTLRGYAKRINVQTNCLSLTVDERGCADIEKAIRDKCEKRRKNLWIGFMGVMGAISTPVVTWFLHFL